MTLPQSPNCFSKLTIAQLIISLFGLVYSLLAVSGVIYLAVASSEMTGLGSSDLSNFYWILGFTILLTIPSIVLSMRELKGKEDISAKHPRSRFIWSSISLVLFAPALYLGIEMAKSSIGKVFLPLVSILLIVIPLVWFLEFGRRNLSPVSNKRFWGILNGSIFFSMPIIFIVEGSILLMGLVWLGTWIFEQPNLLPMLKELTTFSALSPSDLQPVMDKMQGLISGPRIIFIVVFGFSVIVPLVEELFKPLVLWFFVKRNITPADGFTIGLICGAAFALIESISAISSVEHTLFVTTAIGRVGTGLLHTLNSGLIGWALAATWQDGKYLRVAGAYLGAVLLHGIWNFFSLVFGFSNSGLDLPSQSSSLVQAAPWMLGLLGVWMITLLFVMNQRLQRTSTPPTTPSLLTPPPIPTETL